MDAEQRATAEALDGMMAQRASRYWWAVLLSGIAWVLVGWVILRMDVRSLAAVGVAIGVVLLLCALNEAVLAQTVTGGWRVLHYGIAVAFVLAAAWAFVRPINTFFALASVLGLILILEGAFEIVRAVGSRDQNPFWLVGLFSGILLILLAFWVSSSDREFNLGARSFLILFWVGVMALFRGLSQIGLGFGTRWLTRNHSAQPADAGAAGAARTISARDGLDAETAPARNAPTA